MHDGRLDDLRREAEELRAARQRLIATADADRRRIEHELHDGVQQQLVALAINLQLARQVPDKNPGALNALLEEMGRDVQLALDDVRRLAARVYPSSLLDRGLVDALRAAATVLAIRTRVEATHPDERYPAEVESAAYFCCLEALEAAARPQQPEGRAIIRLRREQDALVFDVIVEVRAPEPWNDEDLLGIGDRLGSVGGRLAPSPENRRGTCLSGTIPIP